MRTIAINLYRFSELSEEARKKAIEWYRDISTRDSYWSDFVISDFITICQLMGITTSKREILFSGFWSQGDGASFMGTFTYTDDIEHKLRQYAPQDQTLIDIALKLDELYATCGNNAGEVSGKVIQKGYYCHSNTMYVDLTCDVEVQNKLPDDADRSFLLLFRDLADWLYRQLETEYNHYISDEHIAEVLEANDYEFEEGGEIRHER